LTKWSKSYKRNLKWPNKTTKVGCSGTNQLPLKSFSVKILKIKKEHIFVWAYWNRKKVIG